MVVADTGNDRVAKFDAAGGQVWTWGGHGSGSTGVSNPRDVGIDTSGNVFVADTGNARVVKLTSDGTFVKSFNGPSGDKIASPIGITVANGEVIVADAGANLIRVFDTNGVQQRTIAATTCPFSRLRDVTEDAAGNYYVANYTADNVLKLAHDGTLPRVVGNPRQRPAPVPQPLRDRDRHRPRARHDSSTSPTPTTSGSRS